MDGRTKKACSPSCAWRFLYLNRWNSMMEITPHRLCGAASACYALGLRRLEEGKRMHMTTPTSRLDVEQAEARSAWVTQARCREVDPDQLFVRGAAQRKAATICRHCPVLMQCGADALDNRVEFGVWGGMTERQRRALLKQHPEVDSWSDFFEAQRQHQSAV